MALTVAPAMRYGIVLMVLSASAPHTRHRPGQQGGDREMVDLLQVMAAIAAIVTILLMATLSRQVFSIQGWALTYADGAWQVLAAQVLPLLPGLGLRRWFAAVSARLVAPLEKLASGLLLLTILGLTMPVLGAFLASNLLAQPLIAAMAVLSLAVGWLLAGPSPAASTTTALATSMRNPGLALLFATSHAPGIPMVKLTILSCVLLVTILVSILF